MKSIDQLEQGEVVILPEQPFACTDEESTFLRPDCVDPQAKTVKFSLTEQRLWGLAAQDSSSTTLYGMLKRYAEFAHDLVRKLLPTYESSLIIGNTSFRPVEAANRVQSLRHDDRLLHVDAFPSRPMRGKRILRVFTNIHPGGQPRVWRTGEPFAKVAERFLKGIRPPLPGSAALLDFCGITKEKRSLYDHYMLNIHDRMKRDAHYQATVPFSTLSMPAGSSWLVFTDQVSHAAMGGQFALEHTFLLPVEAMAKPGTSPLRVLESLKGRALA